MTPRKILFATMPMDGHFNPLTGLAVHLKQQGHDVRWYTGGSYADRADRLGIPVYPFQKARVINQDNLDKLFPERTQIKGAINRIRFDINNVFVRPIQDYMVDLRQIHQLFSFDLVVCDIGFSAISVMQHVFDVPVVVMGIVPLPQSSRDLPPNGIGMTPAKSWMGRHVQSLLRMVVGRMMRQCTDVYNEVIRPFGLPPEKGLLFDIAVTKADRYLQSGTPGFEYKRSDISENVHFVGPLLPHKSGNKRPFRHAQLACTYRRVVLVTQGTVERDPGKIIIPTLEAFKNENDTLVIATTGGSQTAELRSKYPQSNIIIEDFIDFNAVMPYASVFVTNGGYGGVLLSIKNGLPMVVAGVYEGKNEIAARLSHFGLGLRLNTETPKAGSIRRSVEEVLSSSQYRDNVVNLATEFTQYDTLVLCENHLMDVLDKHEQARSMA
ncbi:glycosyltransferase family 1 protein [Spirosoma sp. BT702]|uniref:Glycosyltransferase family 1 protein n=1 Tax=Spirosoma profusum TaxID=2771354 RepID=A0A926Y3J6_9BACT|nr:glycosyltransferase [Spirosoma profusum]MBD2701975.1 glycosyltransferase family 1 protein [Spirosoma profusum]